MAVFFSFPFRTAGLYFRQPHNPVISLFPAIDTSPHEYLRTGSWNCAGAYQKAYGAWAFQAAQKENDTQRVDVLQLCGQSLEQEKSDILPLKETKKVKNRGSIFMRQKNDHSPEEKIIAAKDYLSGKKPRKQILQEHQIMEPHCGAGSVSINHRE